MEAQPSPTLRAGNDDAPPADRAVLYWVVPPVVRALDAAASTLRKVDADAAAIEGACRSLREASGALAIARVLGASQVLEAVERLLRRPGVHSKDDLALCHQGCEAVRDYVSGLSAGAPQRPVLLRSVQRALLLCTATQHSAELDPCFSGQGPSSSPGALEPDVAVRVSSQRERLRHLQELWERCAAGDSEALAPLGTTLHDLIAEGLPHAQLAALAAQAQQSAETMAQPGAPGAQMAIAMATTLLFLEDALAVWPEVGTTLTQQVEALLQWLRQPGLGRGAGAQSLDLQQEAHRREHQRALAARLSEELVGLVRSAQQHMLAVFEEGAAREALSAARGPLLQMQSVLTLMADYPAAAAVGWCAQRLGAWQDEGLTVEPDALRHVIATVCGLDYYFEQLAFGNADLAALLRRAGVPDAVAAAASTGSTRAPQGRSLPTAQDDMGGLQAPAPEPIAASTTLVQSVEESGPVDAPADAGMLQIFLEEAAEVMSTLRRELDGLRHDSGNAEQLGVVRRAYHTLKGSGRMVGLTHLGEAAWAIEQVLNSVLQQSGSASGDLLRLLELAQARFDYWIERLGAEGRVRIDGVILAGWAERIRRGERLPADADDATEDPPQPQPGVGPQATVAAMPERRAEIARARVSPGVLATFIAEAGGHVSTLRTELAVMSSSSDGAASYEAFRAAHTLTGIAGTTGFQPLSALAGELERILQLLHHHPRPLPMPDAEHLKQALAALDRMVGAIARSAAPEAAPELAAALARLADRLLAEAGGHDVMHTLLAPAQSDEAPAAGPTSDLGVATGLVPRGERRAITDELASPHGDTGVATAERRRGRVPDDLDNALLPVFLEEAADLVPQIGQALRDWRAYPNDTRHPQALKRLLHTLKGSARMAGAMGLGELTHSLETRVADAAERSTIPERVFDSLYVSFDRMGVLLEELESKESDSDAAHAQTLRIDAPLPGAPALLRVRAELVDRLVDEAGDVSIARARMELDVRTLRAALRDLGESVIRLRSQVREVEIQAETQMESRLARAKQAEEQFDPLEFDRFTRLQELTRFLTESVTDVTALQQSILESADSLEATLATQRRTARAVHDGLMRVRLIPVATLTERLHRVARLTAREAGKRVNLEVRGGQVELDRGVMERVAGPVEHLLRNAIVHGIEAPARRAALDKPEAGAVVLEVRQESNEVVLTLADDGGGLDLVSIRQRAISAGLIDREDDLSDQQTAQLIFASGLSTSDQVTQEAGRGVGLDVVRTEIESLGGRVQLAFEAGKHTCFTIYLPVTLSVMQAVLVGSAGQTFALPTLMVEQVQKVRAELLAQLFEAGEVQWQGYRYPLYDLQQLLGDITHVPAARRYNTLVLLRSGASRAAVHVDDLVGNQEIVVKSVGSQLARVAGIAGAALLGSGESVLILNPVALTQSVFGVAGAGRPAGRPMVRPEVLAEAARPTVMVVDDSLTIRRVTGRLLARAGYDVVEARDGVDALEKLRSALPKVLLLDIEMPRMDGFELARRVRDDPRLRHVAIIVISSRTAEKHRKYAAELGVNLFLGKPYQEDALLGHIAGYVAGAPDAAAVAA